MVIFMKDELNEIKRSVGSEALIIGFNRIIKNLKAGKLEKIFVASNPKEELLKDIQYYSSINKTPVIKLDVPNTELGALCKKQFPISFLAIIKSEE